MDKLSKNKIYIPIIIAYIIICVYVLGQPSFNIYEDILLIIIGFIIFYKAGSNLIKIKEDTEINNN